jgi:hypothetical protein
VTATPIVLQPAGPRVVLLMQAAYAEEGLAVPEVDERINPVVLQFPRSFVDGVNAMGATKSIDYSFMGSVYRPELEVNRAWVLDFAATRFTERSHLLISEGLDVHHRLGSFDHTGDDDAVFVPKNVPEPERDFFNPAYFRVLAASQFALCPAGDLPWSLRFFEAIMCRAIPILSSPEHAGRNDLERAIGYRYYLADEAHVYDEAIVEANYERFLRHQTLLTNPENGTPSP